MVRKRLPTVHLSVLISLVRFILGIVIVLFFHCLSALLSRVHRRREGTKWGLVAYTMVMFAFVTVFTAMNLNVQSDSYIDNREYPGDGDTLPPGPIGYQALIYSDALTIIPNLMFLLNNWMADGLLVSLFDSASQPKYLTRTLLAVSLLCYLLHEPLGHRLPLHHVPRLCGCVFEFSKSWRRHSGLTTLI